MTTTSDSGGGWQAGVNAIITGPPSTLRAAAAPTRERGRTFSAFVDEDLQRATDIAGELMRVAESDGIDAAVARAASIVSDELPGLVQYAVNLYVTHDPAAREAFPFPPLERRQPNLVRSSAATETAGATPPEDRLDYWREDPLLNEHHEHWHLVYPMVGQPSPAGPVNLGDRHGELFAYMHEQMLARYDAERLSVGLSRVVAFDNYTAPAAEGYDPGDLTLWDGDEWSPFRARPSGSAWSDLGAPFAARPGAVIADQAGFHDKLVEAGTTGSFTLPTGAVPVTRDNLGNSEEANANSVGKPTYGNHHNDGHIHWMYFDNTMPFGVMSSTATAVRDPIFFRWHKNVDGVFDAFRVTESPYDFSDGPTATVHDLIVLDAGGSPTDALETEVLQRNLLLGGDTVSYIAHDDFAYEFDIENTDAANPVSVALRVFLAPDSEKADRTAWIELDRFTHTLAAGERAVVNRNADVSAVVRKPALRPADLTPADTPSPETDTQSWCDCGWPYTMLLPRGNAAGMPFRLLVMLSNGSELSPPDDDECTSISYCGLQDANYPDTRAMGYPFDRPLSASIEKTVDAHRNWFWRPLTIRCRTPDPT